MGKLRLTQGRSVSKHWSQLESWHVDPRALALTRHGRVEGGGWRGLGESQGLGGGGHRGEGGPRGTWDVGRRACCSHSPPAFISSTCPQSGGERQNEVGVRSQCWGSSGERKESLLLSGQDEGDL